VRQTLCAQITVRHRTGPEHAHGTSGRPDRFRRATHKNPIASRRPASGSIRPTLSLLWNQLEGSLSKSPTRHLKKSILDQNTFKALIITSLDFFTEVLDMLLNRVALSNPFLNGADGM
jgi:hypothetical protein